MSKIIGLLCVRNESWILNVSARAALNYCDELVIVDHASTDETERIVHDLNGEYPWRIQYSRWHDPEWKEMEIRQHSLELGRKFRGTHFVMVDADEVLTANLLPQIGDWIKGLKPGEVLDLPMIPMRDLDHYQDDDSVWSRAFISTAFADAPNLTWKPSIDGYQHHHRLPYGTNPKVVKPLAWMSKGGVMHLQFANERRLLAKHILYAMNDHLRWPGRETVQELNWKYGQALQPPRNLTAADPSWWAPYDKSKIKLDGIPWQEFEIRRLVKEHGIEKFAGLDFRGWK